MVGAQVTSDMVRSIGGKGSVLLIHGFAGTTPDTDRIAGAKAVLSRCPGIKLAGEIYGGFATSVAKAAMLSFLSTHPEPLSGIMTVGSMTVGSIEALQQSGRQVPFMTTVTAMKGDLGYWRQHRSSFNSAGTIEGGTALGSAVADIALRTLEGQGPKLNYYTAQLPLVTDQNLGKLVGSTWTLQTPGFVDAPVNSLMPNTYLNPLFAHGQTPR